MIKAWKKVFSQTVYKNNWIHLTENHYLNADKSIPSYFLFHGREHVIIVPITLSGKIVLVQLYRPGTDTVGWELPAGCFDVTDLNAPDAALRELLEETGYTGDPIFIQKLAIDSSRQTNCCHVIAVRNCKKVAKQKLDDTEDISVGEFDFNEIENLIFTNQFIVSGQIGALYLTKKLGFI